MPNIGPLAKDLAGKAILSAGGALAATALIPDHAVMTRQELNSGVELSKRELNTRKLFVPMLIGSTAAAGNTLLNLDRNLNALRSPGIGKKLKATAAILGATPAFVTSYKMIKNRIDTGEGTLNIKQLMGPKTTAAVVAVPKITGFVGDVVAPHITMAEDELAQEAALRAAQAAQHVSAPPTPYPNAPVNKPGNV